MPIKLQSVDSTQVNDYNQILTQANSTAWN